MFRRSLSLLAFLLCAGVSFGQSSVIRGQVSYQYPLDAAASVSPATTLGYRSVHRFAPSALTDAQVTLTGSVSGDIHCTVTLTRDRHMLLVKPAHAFALGEHVDVSIDAPLEEASWLHHTTSFTVVTRTYDLDRKMLWQTMLGTNAPAAVGDDTAEPVLPPMHVITDIAPSDGSLFLCNFGFGPIKNPSYLLVLDKHGAIEAKRQLQTGGSDFKLQPNGELTYCDYSRYCYVGLDSKMQEVHTYGCANGYIPDLHDLLCFRDGGYMILGASSTPIYLGDYPLDRTDTAILLGNVVQEFDRDRNLIFEWRGIDHYNLMDAPHISWRDTSMHQLDFEHANSIDTDLDGNIILSNRHLDEISKIDRTTGEFIWRLGGVHNEFTFPNDTLKFTYQHAARIIGNGHLTVFDNGNYHPTPESRALELELDTKAMTATRVWEYRHTPGIFGFAMGYVQRLENGNTLVSWGSTNDASVTEVDPNNNVVFDMALDSGNFSYRVFKFMSPLRVETSGNAAESLHLVSTSSGAAIDLGSGVQPGAELRISDLLGREVAVRRLTNGELTVPLSSLDIAPGYYRITVMSEAGTRSIGVSLDE